MSVADRGSEVVSIQYLRGVAALLVVVAHAADQFPSGLINETLRLIGQGGVDIFFVISGYVMTYTEAVHGYTRAEFLRRRLTRIVPLYWMATITTAVMLIIAPNLAKDSHFAWSDLITSLLFIPHHNAANPALISPLLKLGWTLNYEMFFYVAFAAAITFQPVRRTATLVLAFCCLIAAVALFRPDSAPLQFWGNPILLEFLFGCAIGCADLRRLTMIGHRWLWVCTLSGAAVAFALFGEVDADLANRVAMRGVPGAMIVLAAISLERSSPPQARSAWLHFLGDASYSIYLWHLVAIVGLRVLWLKMQIPHAEQWQAVAFMTVALAVGSAFGCLVYVVLERRLSRAAKRFVGGLSCTERVAIPHT